MAELNTAASQGKSLDPASGFDSHTILESLEAFGEIAHSVSGASDIPEMCDRVVAVLKARLGLRTCSIMLVGEDGETLVNVAGTSPRNGGEGAPTVHRSFRIGEGVAGLAAQTGEPVLVADVEDDARFSGTNSVSSVRSLICLPIMRGGAPLGVLNLSHDAPGFFRKDHQTVFSILATILGRMLAEARLTEELACFNRDLEAQVAARTREIRASHAYLEQILSQASEIILTVDWRGRVTYVNRRIRDMGYGDTDLIGKPFSALSDSETLPPALIDAMAGEVSHNVGLTLYGTDGSAVDSLCSFSPMEDPGGEGGNGALVMIRDVSDNRRMEQKLRQMEKLTAVGTLVAGIAHEINNKLVPILVYSELLQRSDIPEKELKLIKTVHRSAVGARHIMESLLRFSRQETSKKEVKGVNSVVDEVLGMVQFRARKQDIDLSSELAEGLPELTMDAHQIAQVTLNILNNACDAVEEGQGRVVVSTHLEGDWVRLRVEDNGPGMDADTRQRIFDPFFTTKEVGKGTGLGLSLCYGIIQEHGGDIRVDSGADGTRFDVLLPIHAAGDSHLINTEGGGDLQNVSADCLIADDDPVLLDVLEHVLGNEHQVVREASGAGVVRQLSERDFDVVVLDLHMSDMDGEAVYDWIVDNRPEMSERVLIMTGSITDFETRLGSRVPVERLIPKPFHVREVRQAIGRLLAVEEEAAS
ncbi:MAG: ATP-binding protein [Leptospirillia bacterium]